MGFFSSGTEGEGYQSCYCFRCKNWKKEMILDEESWGCPIWDVHIIYNPYGSGVKIDVQRDVLDMLIPTNKDTGRNEQCRMFEEKNEDKTSDAKP